MREFKNAVGKFAVSSLEAIRFEFLMKGALVIVEIWFSVVGDSQISLIVSKTLYSCDTVGREL